MVESLATELVAPMTGTPTRYYGLDGVRATAMLLGVFYHLPISFMNGGFGMGFGGRFGESPKAPIDEWLHSFRMPLFFLISGFFANMMLGKYGLQRYLTRRWWRIGHPGHCAVRICRIPDRHRTCADHARPRLRGRSFWRNGAREKVTVHGTRMGHSALLA